MSDHWIEDIKIGMCGNGWFARIDGNDVMDFYPGRISHTIAERCKTEKQARDKAIKWVEKQLRKLKNG